MPICCMCRQEKPAAAFAFRSIATGELQSHCRECHAVYRRQHYLDNKPIYIAREVARIKRFREQNRLFLFDYLLTHPCVDCGETDVLVLEFDHRNPADKRFDIGFIVARKPWKFVLAEIEKCDVRCANCHRRRTAAQFNWARLAVGATQLPPSFAASALAVVALPLSALDVKVCTRCANLRPIADFYIKDKKTGRRSTICRDCRSAYGKAHYRNNKPAYLKRAPKNRKAFRANNRSRMLEYLVGKCCVDCGATDPLILEFDHRDGVAKEAEVAWLISRTQWSKIDAEIAKCDVRCANCHRRRTAAQFGWTKLQLQKDSQRAS